MSDTIEKTLKYFQSDNPIVRIIKAENLREQLNALAKSSPEFGFFVYLINHYCKRYTFPEDILELCKALKIITWKDLCEWVKVVDGKVIMPIIDPQISFNLTVKKTNAELKQMILTNCDCEANCQWDFGDANYYLLSKDNLREVLDKCPIDKRKYIKERYDCENYARDTKSWLSLHELNQIAWGNIEVNFYHDSKLLFAHGINLVPLEDGSIVCVEPQRDQIWPANQPEYGFGANKMKLRLVQF